MKLQDSQSNARAGLGLSVLLWLSHAKRPMTVPELQHAIAVDTEADQINELTDPDFFVDCCFGLVVRVKETNVIRLVHQSVNEYLQSHRGSLFPNGHETITRCCIWYFIRYQAGYQARRERFARLNNQGVASRAPFFPYATAYCMAHAVDATEPSIAEYIRSQFSTPSIIDTWVEAVRTFPNPFFVVGNSWDGFTNPRRALNRGATLLHIAAIFGIDLLMEALLEQPEANPNAQDSQGVTPLMAAAGCGHKLVVESLLARGDVDVDLKDSDGCSALDWAVNFEQVQAVQALLDSPHDIDINTNVTSSSCVTQVYQHPWANRDILPLYLRSRRLDLRSAALTKPVDEDTGCFWVRIARFRDPAAFFILLDRPDFDPWIWGCPRRSTSRLLRDAKYSLYNVDFGTEWNPDLYDVEFAQLRLRRLSAAPLIAHAFGTDPRFDAEPFSVLEVLWPFVYYSFCEDFYTAIDPTAPGNVEYEIDWMTIRDTATGILRQLFQERLKSKQITFLFQDCEKRGFVHYLAHAGNEKHLDFFLALGGPYLDEMRRPDAHGRVPLHYAASKGHEYVVRALLLLGADLLARDETGSTAFHHAIRGGHGSTVRLLLSRIPAVQARHLTNGQGETLLHIAARSKKSTLMTSLLLGRGHDVRAVDFLGRTPLHNAIVDQDEDTCRLLLEHGANPDHRSLLGGTSLTTTASYKSRAIQCLLLRQSALDVNALNNSGLNIFEILSDRAHHSGLPRLATEQEQRRTGAVDSAAKERRRRHQLRMMRARARLLVSLKKPQVEMIALGGASMLLKLGDVRAAQILLEVYLDNRSKVAEPFFITPTSYGLECAVCQTSVGFLNCCQTCIFFICTRCLEKGSEAPPDRTLASCEEHRYVRIPREEWSKLPDGVVTLDGMTFEVWLEELKEKYETECQVLDLDGGYEPYGC